MKQDDVRRQLESFGCVDVHIRHVRGLWIVSTRYRGMYLETPKPSLDMAFDAIGKALTGLHGDPFQRDYEPVGDEAGDRMEAA